MNRMTEMELHDEIARCDQIGCVTVKLYAELCRARKAELDAEARVREAHEKAAHAWAHEYLNQEKQGEKR